MRVGGTKSVIEAVAEEGGDAGPRTYWVGAWTEKHGWGGLAAFYEDCRKRGDEPLVHLWTFGDSLNAKGRSIDDILTKGVQDTRQGVWMDWSVARSMAAKVASMAKTAGVMPLVSIESEFTKKDAATSEKMRDFLWDLTNTLRREHPGIRLIFAPGIWADATAIGAWYKDVAASMDYIGVQAVKFPPRHGDYADTAAEAVEKLSTYRDIIGDKPTCIHDCALSTYAGGDKTPPFPGGNGTAFEDEQAEALMGFAALEDVGVEFLAYRDIVDAPRFALSNYGGHAERFVGVVRADGTRKPGYEALMALARPVESPPLWDFEDLERRIESLEARLDRGAEALGRDRGP